MSVTRDKLWLKRETAQKLLSACTAAHIDVTVETGPRGWMIRPRAHCDLVLLCDLAKALELNVYYRIYGGDELEIVIFEGSKP